jgi:hypothetical protein
MRISLGINAIKGDGLQLGYDRIMLILSSNNGEVPPAKMKPQHCCGIQHEAPGCLKVDATNSQIRYGKNGYRFRTEGSLSMFVALMWLRGKIEGPKMR